MNTLDCDLLVIGGGPGGYAAAFRAADLGLRVVIAEKRATLGGVCLNVGCIPSKTYLHQAAIIHDARQSAAAGIAFPPAEIDLAALRAHKDRAVNRLVSGLAALARARKVQIRHGEARLTGDHTARVGPDTEIAFRYAIIAVGSAPSRLPFLPDSPRILDSTSALELPACQGRMLVIGGGIIGLEMATIYCALGMTIDVVELTDQLVPDADRDAVAVWQKANAPLLGQILLRTRVTAAKADSSGVEVQYEQAGKPATSARYDYVLAATGRVANGRSFGAEAAGVAIDAQGLVPVDHQMRSNVRNIFAVGDVVRGPMLAHKAAHQGHVAAEVVAGEITGNPAHARAAFDAQVIPAVSYTNPEIAWAGLTEAGAKASGRAVRSEKFPWQASGRAIANSCEEGFTKLIVDAEDGCILGGSIVGTGAGDMIGEIALAIELHATADDLALTIHPHPTLGETIGLAAEIATATCTDLPPPKKPG